ncbi:MAG TPA: glutamine amidotransferase, partial [Armatimonadota bacterium]|nr:glutamine amidotransferase [Armatimonadota bacterium]
MRTLIIISCLMGAVAVVAGPVAVKRDGNTITMTNGEIALAIDLATGGRVSSFRYTQFDNAELVFSYKGTTNGGLFLDHVAEQPWPGEYLFVPYEAEIVQAGPEAGVVRLWRRSTGKHDGQVNASVSNLLMQRTLTLRANSRVVHCQVAITNADTIGKRPTYWQQVNFAFDGETRTGNVWFRPTTVGVDSIHETKRASRWNWYFAEHPIAGWTGVGATKTNRGIMLLMDYNDLWKFYDNVGAASTEWMYDQVAIPPGKTWTTDVYLIPTPGMNSYTHGGREVIADMAIIPAANALTVTHRLTQGLAPLTDVKLTTRAFPPERTWEATGPEVTVAAVDEGVTAATITISNVKALPVTVQVTLTGTTTDGQVVTAEYGEFFTNGEENLDMVTMAPRYAFPQPAKKKRYLKPDVIALTRAETPRVFFGRGVWHDFTRVDEALKLAAPDAAVKDGWYKASDVSNSLTGFPADYGELLANDLVILHNVDSRAMGGDSSEEMLVDFVKAGGSLLYLAGDLSYSQAKISNARFRDMLPVALGEHAPWVNNGGGLRLQVEKDAAPILGDLQFDGKTAVYYQHRYAAAPDARVLVSAGGHPLLVARQYGKGRVVACLA